MTIKDGEIGKLVVVNANYNLSGYTELKLSFTKPDLTVVEVTTANGVSAPAVDLTVDVDGVPTTFLANQYWQYPTESGVMTPAGTNWKVHGEYIDATPKDFCGDTSTFTVYPC